jgi:hypothetical protein
MRRIDQDPFAGGSLDPPDGRTPTGKDQWVQSISLDHGEFEITVIWRCGNPFPYWRLVHRFNLTGAPARLEPVGRRFDVQQQFSGAYKNSR